MHDMTFHIHHLARRSFMYKVHLGTFLTYQCFVVSCENTIYERVYCFSFHLNRNLANERNNENAAHGVGILPVNKKDQEVKI